MWGRLQFADGQLFGRLGKLCFKAITEHACSQNGCKISNRCHSLLALFSRNLEVGKPRIISLASSSNWFVFTDARFEPENESWKCGLGGILVDMTRRAAQYLSLCLRDEQIGDLGGPIKKTIIFEAEVVAVILAIRLWMERIPNAMAICFIDNNSARDIAISASGRSNFAMALVEVLLQSEHRGSFFPWFARVPSQSNPADSLSRNRNEQLEKHGVSLVLTPAL